MKRPLELILQMSIGLLRAFLMAAMLSFILMATLPACAFADGGVTFVSAAIGQARGDGYATVSVNDGDESSDVPTQPTNLAFSDDEQEESSSTSSGSGFAWFAALQFDKNVSYVRDGSDSGFVDNNVSLVHLYRADNGEEVEINVRPGATMEERQLLYVEIPDWLDPLTGYELVVDKGIMAANGQDLSEQPYSFRFTTSDLCSNGLTIAQNILMVVLPLIFVAGIAVAVIRRVHNR